MLTMRSQAFDNLHSWIGDALPKSESAAFQVGKARVLKKLLPYAHEDSQREAASVVLQRDGSEFGFWVGTRFSVESSVPANRLCAHLHTHFSDEPPSEVDWANFLLVASVRQSHIICPHTTYSLHKPLNWLLPEELQSEGRVKDLWANSYLELDRELRTQNQVLDDLEFDERATQKLAARSGILFRIGTRK